MIQSEIYGPNVADKYTLAVTKHFGLGWNSWSYPTSVQAISLSCICPPRGLWTPREEIPCEIHLLLQKTFHPVLFPQHSRESTIQFTRLTAL